MNGVGSESEDVSRAELPELAEGNGGSNSSWVRRNLDLVKNLKVPVAAVLGSAEITVEELFHLKEGATVTLDQPVDAVVDLTVEGKVVARGEIVVVGDNFGVRVVELLAPEVVS